MANTITVRRPGGEIEVVDVTAKYPSGLTPALFAAMKKATQAAGRGELVRWDNSDGYNSDQAAIDAANRAARKAKADAYDRLYNEGGEGFNPHR